jgi:hypothetical protein
MCAAKGFDPKKVEQAIKLLKAGPGNVEKAVATVKGKDAKAVLRRFVKDAAPFKMDASLTNLAEKVQLIWRAAPNTQEGIDAAKVKMRATIQAAGATPERLAQYVTKMATSMGRRVNVNHIKNLARDFKSVLDSVDVRAMYEGATTPAQIAAATKAYNKLMDMDQEPFSPGEMARLKKAAQERLSSFAANNSQSSAAEGKLRMAVQATGRRPSRANDGGDKAYVKKRVYADVYELGQNWANSGKWLDVGTELTYAGQSDKSVDFKGPGGKTYSIDFADCRECLVKRRPK